MFNKFLIILFLPAFIYANAGLDSKISSALQKTYNFELDSAEVLFTKLISEFPSQPHGYHYLAQINLWKYLGTREDTFLQKFYSFSDVSILKADSTLEDNPEDPKLLNITGWIYTLRAIAKTSSDETLDAFWATKNAVGYFEDSHDADTSFYDSFLGQGIFDYSLSFVPGIFQWALTLTGLSSDKYLGFQEINLAYLKSKASYPESSYHLARLFTEYIADYDSADYHLSNLIEKYPKNPLFRYQKVLMDLDSRDLLNAENEIHQILFLNNPYLKQTNIFCLFLLGEINFRQNNFNDAIEFYKEFTEKSLILDYVGMANYKIALCYGMLNCQQEFQYFLLKSNLGNMDIYDDVYAREQGKKYYNRFLNLEEKVILICENFISSGNYSTCLDSTSKYDSLNFSQISKIKMKVLEMDALINLGQILKARNTSSILREHIPTVENYYKPYYYLLDATLNFISNKPDLAKKSVLLAEEDNDFEFPQKLSAKINYLKRELGLKL